MKVLCLLLQALLVSAYITPSTPRIVPAKPKSGPKELQCESKGLMMAPLCEEEVANETAANLEDITTMAQQWTDTNLTSKVEIGDCDCCALAITPKSAMRLCNKKHVTTLISYALLGMTARIILEENDCVRAKQVKGSYIWDSRSTGMRFTLDVVGPDSAGLYNLPACTQATVITTYSLTEGLPKEVNETSIASSDIEMQAPTNSSSEASLDAGQTPDGSQSFSDGQW